MYLDSQEKRIIKTLTTSNEFNIEQVIETVLKDINCFDRKAFQVFRTRGRNSYNMGVTSPESLDEQEIDTANEIASYISKSIKLIDKLEKDSYLHITKLGIPSGKPLLSVGKQQPNENNLIGFENKEIVEKIVYLLTSRIEVKEKLIDFIRNDFRTESQVNFDKSFQLTAKNSRNSSIIVMANIFGLFMSLAAIGFSFYTFNAAKTANDATINSLNSIAYYTENLEHGLDSLAVKLNEVPTKLASFSETIEQLNETVDEQQESFVGQTKELNKSLNEFSESIKSYQNYVQNYGNQLGQIVELTDQQLEIWKDQQKIVLEEYSRRPSIKASKENCSIVKGKLAMKSIILENEGNIQAEIESLIITVKRGLMSDVKTSECMKKSKAGFYDRYDLKCGEFGDKTLLIPGQPASILFQGVANKLSKEKIKVQISYLSNYESKTVTKYLSLNNCL